MKYSFVLPAYKATFLREAIDSILNQTYKDFELIIVNDASPEDLSSIVNNYSDERIQYYVNEKNIGGTDLVAQWNHCITYAKGEYLILASDDDIYHSDYLAKMDVLIDKHPQTDVFRPRVQHIDYYGNKKTYSDKMTGLLSQIKFAYFLYERIILSGVPFYIFRRNVLIEQGGFINHPVAWFSDDATAIRMARNGIVMHDEILFFFRHSGLNLSCFWNDTPSLLGKLRATQSYFTWLAGQLEKMDIPEVDREYKMILNKSRLKKDKLDHMIWLVKNSYRGTVLRSWSIMKKVQELSLIERIKISYNVFCYKLLRVLKIKTDDK